MTAIARSLEEAAGFGPCALTIGNFDGVHSGHQALLRATVEEARALGVKAGALTFDPHPSRIVAPDRAPKLLCSLDERCAEIARCGIETSRNRREVAPQHRRIIWRQRLADAPFNAILDEMFELRAKTSNGSSNVYQIHLTTLEMTTKLRNRIDEIPAKQYIAARKFLDSLDYTAQNPAG